MGAKGSKERIREQLQKVELSDSAYDTAWVAMVPSPGSPEVPCFPQCVDWILHNQHLDGSWGLDFIRSNFSFIADEDLPSPIGFEILFPGMLGFATDMSLDLAISPIAMDGVLFLIDLQLKSASRRTSEAGKAYKAYVAEGLGKSQDWNELMKYQRKNGSLFISPSTTAAASVYLHDAKALEYLHAVLQKFGSLVPTIYPLEMHTHLYMVDTLEKLGIARHFSDERERAYWIEPTDVGCWMMRKLNLT